MRQFVDPKTSERVVQHLPSVFWELYLARALRAHGVSIVRQVRSKAKQKGPDLLADSPKVWIEAMVAGGGTGPDALQSPPELLASDVPNEQFIMRLTNAFKCKAKAFKKYIEDGDVATTDATVIAISGAELPFSFNERPTPRIVEALLAVGHHVLSLDKATGKAIGRHAEFRDSVRKRNGEPVPTDGFLNSEHRHISAVIYSCADWLNGVTSPGAEFVVVHNPCATVPLPDAWFKAGTEYFFKDSKVRCVKHGCGLGK